MPHAHPVRQEVGKKGTDGALVVEPIVRLLYKLTRQPSASGQIQKVLPKIFGSLFGSDRPGIEPGLLRDEQALRGSE